MRSIRKTASKKAAPKRPTKRTTKRGAKAAAKRTSKRAPKRAAPKTARKSIRKTATKRKTASRRNKVSFARTWERRIEGWRRFFIRHSYMKAYAVLAAGFVALYAIWASGIVGQTGNYISEQTRNATLAAGFTVQRITLEGYEETSASEVIAALDLEYGTPIFDLNLGDLQARVEALDWVHKATVIRALPGRVHVIIEERTPFALWQNQGIFRVVSLDGGVITGAEVGRFSQLPQVVGIGAATEASDLFDAMSTVPELGPRVRSAVRVSNRRWDLHFNSGVIVQLPEQNIVQALEALASYESEHRLLARAISVVDLRLEDRIVVRPRIAAPSQSPVMSPRTRLERET